MNEENLPILVIASGNEKKRQEIEHLLNEVPCKVLSLKDFPGCPEVEETGQTFAENATLKAVAVSEYTGYPALADDSGLEVDALGGAPGIHSARFASTGAQSNASDSDNIALLLDKMQEVPMSGRTARFVCAMVLAVPEGEGKARIVAETRGTVDGRIAMEPRGTGGFGYDPVFLIDEYGKTFGQLGTEIKHGMSHRFRALECIRPEILKLLSKG